MTGLPPRIEQIRAYNARFDADLVRRKYAAMRADPFMFLRGTNHLFFDDWPGGALDDAPSSWICGDLHLENFGVYRADNGLCYFDVNDFDEACLAPITRDVARFLTAILVAAPTWPLKSRETPQDVHRWCHSALEAYAAALRIGRPHDVERELATGVVRKLFKGERRRTRQILLDAYTVVHKERRHFVADGEHILPATAEEIAFATALVGVAAERLRWQMPALPPHFFHVHDVARRVAGVGSLGARRYIVVVEGKGSPARNVLLDLKEALPGVTGRHVAPPQPLWESEADRVVTVQQRAQGEPPAFLIAVRGAEVGHDDGASFVMRWLQPVASHLTLAGRAKHVTQALLEELACIAAWSHLRGVGWHGGPTADACIAFGGEPGWRAAILDYAYAYAPVVAWDYAAFCEAYDAGAL